MTRMSSNLGLLTISLLLAVGLVYIKGQEKIQSRVITNVQVTVENLPPNFLLPPEPWLPPTTAVQIQGPRNFVDYIRFDQSSFRINYRNVPPPQVEAPSIVLLTSDMFKTNLEPSDRSKITVLEESIHPRQAVLHLIPWNLEKPIPDVSALQTGPGQLAIPMLRVEKSVPIIVPKEGEAPEGYAVQSVAVEPSQLRITGRREAVDRIKSVSTPTLALEYLSTNEIHNTAIQLPLQVLEKFEVKPVNEAIRSVTVTVKLVRHKQSKPD